MRKRAWEPGYFYHVTFLRNVPAIAARGLQPQPGATMEKRSAFLRKHSKGRVFVSSWETVGFWADSLILAAEDIGGDACKDGLVPVLLRMRAEACVVPDLPGWRDSGAEAFIVPPIPPSELEVYLGRAANTWVPVTGVSHDDFDLRRACRGKRVLEPAESSLMPERLPLRGREAFPF